MLQLYKKMSLVLGFMLVIFLPIVVYSQQDINQNAQIQLNGQMPRQSELQNIIDSSDVIIWGKVRQTESYWRSTIRQINEADKKQPLLSATLFIITVLIIGFILIRINVIQHVTGIFSSIISF